MAIEIDGTYMDLSLNDFQRACEVYIAQEQEQRAPDAWLIALLGEAVRFTRELVALETARNELVDTLNHVDSALGRMLAMLHVQERL